MAGIRSHIGNSPDALISRFYVDSIEEVDDLPTTDKRGKGKYDFYSPVTLGSECIVGNEGGDILVYILFSFGWKEV